MTIREIVKLNFPRIDLKTYEAPAQCTIADKIIFEFVASILNDLYGEKYSTKFVLNLDDHSLNRTLYALVKVEKYFEHSNIDIICSFSLADNNVCLYIEKKKCE